MDFISILSIFVLACFVGYFVVWSVTPALHTPLMSGDQRDLLGDHRRRADRGGGGGQPGGQVARARSRVALASVNIFGGFAVTARMLAMYKKKERR